ncbi:MAG: GH92 family glycosyl hydrolase [Prevotellaceae bacterium]|nr:GH92 family glycosyl hydrolase [Prevotellaceae bacterium]
MRRTLIIALVLLPCLTKGQRLTDYVDPMIGTGGHGHVLLGANVPQGMVSAGPTQLETGWDWCSGYHYDGDSIVGFAQMHLSGTGRGDLGDIALMPTLQEVELSREGLASSYSHLREIARPGYYSVVLDRGNIRAEITATARVALYRFTFPRGSNNARVVIDLENATADERTGSRVYQLDEFTIAGFRESRGWAQRQQVYFYIQFSKPIHNWLSASPSSPYAQATFEVGPGETVLAKVALSPTNEMNARLNMAYELPAWDFEATRRQAEQAWEEELGRIKATFRTEREARIFYTGLYHFLVAPSLWQDITGDYMGSDGRVRHSADFTNYTTFSLWDTYRAAHPLSTLILRDRLADYAETMLRMWEQDGELPVWHLMSNQTYCMVGCPAIPVLADLCLKGVEGFDVREAYDAMKGSLSKQNRGLKWLNELGYVPYDVGEDKSVSKSLEYFLACWSTAQVAGMLGERDDSAHYAELSLGYKKLFDPETLFIRPLSKDGTRQSLEGFNPCHQTEDYTEGTPWQYTWLVPHDVRGLIDCFGSEQRFTERLDSLFLADGQLNPDANPDITGLIGQYAHGNEPSHHILYLYNYVGQPWKTAEKVRYVLDRLYDDKPDGLCGNEDAGQMSAWYILSALGLYQVAPCGGVYILGSPSVETAVIDLGEGKTLTIRTHGGSDKAIYVQEVRLNGKPYPYSYIRHQQLVEGAELDFLMGEKPSKWGTQPKHQP